MPGLNPEVELFIKRDDNTGATLTGNKVRKLEFLLSDALDQGADTIITCGMATSNHCRTTALACAKIGLECHLVSHYNSIFYHPAQSNHPGITSFIAILKFSTLINSRSSC